MAWGNITFFQSSGKTPSFSIDWKIRLNGRAMDLPQSLIIRIDVILRWELKWQIRTYFPQVPEMNS